MENTVFSSIFKKFKIFKTVIISYIIYMVNSFFRFKKSFKMFFHNQSTSFNITIVGAKWMMWLKYIYITIFSNQSSFPQRTFFSFVCIRHFFSCFKRAFSTYLSFVETFTRTINYSIKGFVRPNRFFYNFLMTYFALFHNKYNSIYICFCQEVFL